MFQQVWKDSYDKLFNAKVKKYMKGNKTLKENRQGKHNGSLTTQTLDRKSGQVNVSDLLEDAKSLMPRDVPSKNLTSVDREINIRGGTFPDPKTDVGVNAPDSNLILPNTQGSPVKHLTKGHFKGPKAVLNSSDTDMDVPSVNVKKPKFKLSKFSLSGNKNTDISYDGSTKGSKLAYPEVDAGLNGSDIQIDGPKADFKGRKKTFQTWTCHLEN